MTRLVWQPYMVERGRIIDGTVFAEPDEDRAVIARIGGNLYRERDARDMRHGVSVAPPHRDLVSDTDKWVRQDAESLAAGRSYRRGDYYEPYSVGDGTEPGDGIRPASFAGHNHIMSARQYGRAMLPESAFDWPIYKAALAPLVDEWLDAHMDEQDG